MNKLIIILGVMAFALPNLSFAAIAHDASATSTNNNTASGWGWTATTTGSNRYIVAYVFLNKTGVNVTAVTYAGASMTKLISYEPTQYSNYHFYMYGLANPASGAHNFVVTQDASSDNSSAISESYTGVDQTTPNPDTAAKTQSMSTSGLSLSVTTSVANSVLIGATLGLGDAVTAGANTEIVTDQHAALQSVSVQNSSLTPLGTGSNSLAVTVPPTSGLIFMIDSLAPAASVASPATKPLSRAFWWGL